MTDWYKLYIAENSLLIICRLHITTCFSNLRLWWSSVKNHTRNHQTSTSNITGTVKPVPQTLQSKPDTPKIVQSARTQIKYTKHCIEKITAFKKRAKMNKTINCA